MSPRTRPTAAILCGGRGRRMGGADKGALTLAGQSFIERQVHVLEPLTAEILLVGRHSSHQFGPHVRTVADLVPNGGALGGIYTALVEAASELVVVVACDMPFITTPFIGMLADAVEGADVVLPLDQKGRHALCGVFHRRIAPTLRAQLDAGALRIDATLAQLSVRFIAGDDLRPFDPDGRLLLNVNTPGDYDEAARGDARGSACA